MEVVTPPLIIKTKSLPTPPFEKLKQPPPSKEIIRNLINLLKIKLQSLEHWIIKVQVQQIATIKKLPDRYDRESAREFLTVALNIIEERERKNLKVLNNKLQEIGPIRVTSISPFEVIILFGASLTAAISHVLSEGCLLTMSSPGGTKKRAIITELSSSNGVVTAVDRKGKLEAGTYTIEFPYSAKVMQKKLAMVNGLNPFAIFPDSPPIICSDSQHDAEEKREKSIKLNDWQIHSINEALHLQPQDVPAPYLVRGPPGTGKTTTLIELILKIAEKAYQLVEGAELLIIVCTPSNRAADNIIERIPAAVLGVLKVMRLRSEGEMSRSKKEKEIPGIEYSSTFTPYTVVVCTIGVLHKLYDKEGVAIESPTHLIVDEASQVADTDMILALGLLKPKTKFIMFGDDRQLGPVITEVELRKSVLAISMFERLLKIKKFEQRSVCLLENYRSVPGVVAAFNKLFYENTLIAKVNKEDYPEIFALKLKIHSVLVPHDDTCTEPSGVYFYNVRGFCASRGESHSWKNKKEAIAVESIFFKLISAGVRPTDIGIITPYTDQVKLLEEIVKNPALTTIGSVDSFQGQERSVIIVSTVRSTGCFGIGFVGNRKRLTVTLSRAKTALIVVGNGKILRKYSKVLREFIDGDGMNYLN